MKILMLNGHYSDAGGAEVFVNNLAAGLREKGHEVLLFCFGDKKVETDKLIVIEEPRSDFVKYVYQFLIHPQGYARLRKIIGTFKPDIIHLHNIDKHILTFLLPVKNHKTLRSVHDYGMVCPYFWGIHRDDRKVCDQGIGFKCVRHQCINFLTFPFYYYLFAIKHYFQKKRITGYVTTTRSLKKYMEAQGFDDISVLPYFTAMHQEVVEYPSDPRILYVGRLEENKGCESLIKAFKIIAGQIPEAKLTIVGNGLKEGKLKNLSRDLDLERNVHFAGAVEHDRIAVYYRNAAAVAVPSVCMDNSPLVIYEALSQGRPVVGTDRGGIPDLIESGYNGLLVHADDPAELADALIHLLKKENAELYRQMARNAFSSSHQYSAGSYIDHLEMIYGKL